VKLSSDDPDAQLGLAVALYRQGQVAEATQLAKAAIGKDKQITDLEFLRKRFWSEAILKGVIELFQSPLMKTIR
jgi:hypothetical protein